MNKKISDLRKEEEKRIYNELLSDSNIEKNLRNYELFSSLSIMSFIMGIVIIIVTSIYKKQLIGIDDSLTSLFVLIFILFSLISLVLSYYYNSKTIDNIKKYR